MKSKSILFLIIIFLITSKSLIAENDSRLPATINHSTSESYAQVLFEPNRPYAVCAAYIRFVKKSAWRADRIIAEAPSPQKARETFTKQLAWLKSSRRWPDLYADEIKSAQKDCKRIDL